jgi:ATP-dependent DNA ligase
MMAMAATTLPKGPEWLYAVKWDGHRTIVTKDRRMVSVVSRNPKNVMSQYPAASLTALSNGSLSSSKTLRA